jgi:hypothetical protein
MHQGLGTAHCLLRFPLADMCHPVVAFVPEGEQIWQDPAPARRIELATLEQLLHKAGVEQRGNGGMKTSIIGTQCTAIGPAMLQLTVRTGEIFLCLREIVMHRSHSNPKL